MTPKRKAALQWFHDRGNVPGSAFELPADAPSIRLIRLMLDSCELRWSNMEVGYSLTDLGRRRLHGDDV